MPGFVGAAWLLPTVFRLEQSAWRSIDQYVVDLKSTSSVEIV